MQFLRFLLKLDVLLFFSFFSIFAFTNNKQLTSLCSPLLSNIESKLLVRIRMDIAVYIDSYTKCIVTSDFCFSSSRSRVRACLCFAISSKSTSKFAFIESQNLNYRQKYLTHKRLDNKHDNEDIRRLFNRRRNQRT